MDYSFLDRFALGPPPEAARKAASAEAPGDAVAATIDTGAGLFGTPVSDADELVAVDGVLLDVTGR